MATCCTSATYCQRNIYVIIFRQLSVTLMYGGQRETTYYFYGETCNGIHRATSSKSKCSLSTTFSWYPWHQWQLISRTNAFMNCVMYIVFTQCHGNRQLSRSLYWRLILLSFKQKLVAFLFKHDHLSTL